ncbi:MAG: hypothetical protein ABW023_01500 [Sphingomonas sp.]
MKRRTMAAALLLILGGCGAREDLKLAQDTPPPATAYGAKGTPGSGDLLKPPAQTRPSRSDDLITSSDKRRSDEFDLPPSN